VAQKLQKLQRFGIALYSGRTSCYVNVITITYLTLLYGTNYYQSA